MSGTEPRMNSGAKDDIDGGRTKKVAAIAPATSNDNCQSSIARSMVAPLRTATATTSRPALAKALRPSPSSRRGLATPVASGSRSSQHRILIVGGGTAGQSISHQLLRSGAFPNKHDIAIIDPAQYHHYQPGWTLVGAGLKDKTELRRPMSELASESEGLGLYEDAVESFDPENNVVKTRDGRTISYEHLIVAPGLKLMPEKIKGLTEALQDAGSNVASVYDYDSCDRVWENIQRHTRGPAIFTQPPQPHKCAGAPQKIMWLALDYWKSKGIGRNEVPITYATALPAMFAVPKYAKVLEELRKERDVEGLFGHNLVSIEGSTATFAKGEEKVTRPFSFLHAVMPQGPHAFIRDSPLANSASGFVDVDSKTTRHVKYGNVWAAGDSSSLPTSKTAAAITGQAPVLVSNLLRTIQGTSGKQSEYDGYTSCPIPTEYGKLVLCEFKYNGEVKESFAPWLGVDQAKPNRAFYHLKKDFFPWVYFNSMVKGTWAGPKGWMASAPGPSTAGGARAFSSSSASSFAGGRRSFSTSARTQRDQPSRRVRDPLAQDPTAVRYDLPGGETFIVRPAPTSGAGVEAATAPAAAAANTFVQESHAGVSESLLPPALKPRSARHVRGPRKDISPAEIATMQQLRSAGGLEGSVTNIARRFQCSETFVRIVAPASKERKEQAKREMAVRMGQRKFGDVLRSEARRARREMW